MKKTVTLIAFATLSFGAAQAQSKAEVSTTRPARIESKEALKQATVKPDAAATEKVENSTGNIKRADGATLMTEAEMKAHREKKAAEAASSPKKKDDQ